MKTFIFLLILTLTEFIDASRSRKKNNKKVKINFTDQNLVKFGPSSEVEWTEASSSITETSSKSFDSNEAESLSSIELADTGKNTRKRDSSVANNNESSPELIAAEALLILGDSWIDFEDNIHVSKKPCNAVSFIAENMLVPLDNHTPSTSMKLPSIRMIPLLYFNPVESTNIPNLSENDQSLMKCFKSNNCLSIASNLIENEARLPKNAKTYGVLAKIMNATRTVPESYRISVAILNKLMKMDPVGTVNIFCETSNIVEHKIDLDAFLLSILIENEISVGMLSSDQVESVLEALFYNENFKSSVNYLILKIQCSPKFEKISKMFIHALYREDLVFIESLLNRGWLRLDHQICASRQCLFVIAHLFGNFKSSEIIRLIKKFNFNLSSSHDPAINPNGDILLASILGRDFESFKALLLEGASYDVKLYHNGCYVTLEAFAEEKMPIYYAAIQSFKNGTLLVHHDAAVENSTI